MQTTLNKIAAVIVTAALIVQISLIIMACNFKPRYKVIDKTTGEFYITNPTDHINKYYLQDPNFSKWCNGRILLKEIKL